MNHFSRRQFLQLLGTLPAASVLSLAPAVLATRMPDVLLEEESPIERISFLTNEQFLEVERVDWDIRNEYAKAARTDGSLWIGPLVHQRRTLHVFTYDIRTTKLLNAFHLFQLISLNFHLRHADVSYSVEGYLTKFSTEFTDPISFNFDVELMRLL